jgi:hypothetical protein
MPRLKTAPRVVLSSLPSHLKRPTVRLQPVLAKKGTPNIDLKGLAQVLEGVGCLESTITVESPEHWARSLQDLGSEVDGILPVSITAYPTEVWNAHPQPLVERGLPFIFWSILQYDEPDFWRWSARDFLTALGVTVHLVRNNAHGLDLLRALAMKRFLSASKLVVFGEQNFPWNATAAGHLVTQALGTQIVVRPLSDIRTRAADCSKHDVDAAWERHAARCNVKDVRAKELHEAVRTYLAIQSILEEERALGFGVNCFGDLVIHGGRDVPCLAQVFLREDGYIASCDGDYLAMMSMALTTFLLEQACVMSNMYPVQYAGALNDHFGDPLSPKPLSKYPRSKWKNLARLGHCGFVGVVSPEMAPKGKVTLRDWGGTYEIKRDGRGCGIDADLTPGPVTAVQLKFDGRTLLLAKAEVCETTHHKGMPHCETTALLRFRNLAGFVENISREHSVFAYGDHIEALRVLGKVLGLQVLVF